MQAFADDICVLVKEKTVYRFTEAMKPITEEVAEWARKNGVQFSSLNMNLPFSNEVVSRIPTITLCGQRLKYKTSINCLGIRLDEKLNWLPHIIE